MSKITKFKITGWLLKEVLGMPKETKVLEIIPVMNDEFLMIVEHPDLADVEVSINNLEDSASLITPIITKKMQ